MKRGIEMNYAEIKNFDIANGLGVRVSLFVSGCTHHCKNCFNQMTWDFKYGKEFNQEVEDLIIDYLKPEQDCLYLEDNQWNQVIKKRYYHLLKE